MQLINCKIELIKHCKEAKIPYTIEGNKLCISMSWSIARSKLTQICDSWYSDHENKRVVFLFNSGLVYTLNKKECSTYRKLTENLPKVAIAATFGVSSLNNISYETSRIVFLSPEDAFNMSFLLIDNELLHDEEIV